MYEEIAFVEGRLPCETLGLELGERDGVLRLYDPVTETWLGTSPERVDEANARASEAETRVLEAETRVSEEARARREAEAELEKLRAALQRLQSSE